MSSKEWIKIQSIPKNLGHGKIVNFGRNNILFAASTNAHGDGIYKYNVSINKWTKFIEYPSNFVLNASGMAYSKMHNKIYLYENNGRITVINIKSKQFKTHLTSNNNYSFYAPMINIKGITHLIISTYIEGQNAFWSPPASSHVIWNNENNSMNIVKQFETYHHFGEIIYIQSKHAMLLLGRDFTDISFIYSLKTGKRTQLRGFSGIVSVLDSAVLTHDEKYVIIPSWNKTFYALKIQFSQPAKIQYKLQKSSVRLPDGFRFSFVRQQFECVMVTGGWKDEILVIGYIKKLFNAQEFEPLTMPPIYIMKLISVWYMEEMLHLIAYNDGSNEREHFAISVQHILSSLSDC
eukprot:418350_1